MAFDPSKSSVVYHDQSNNDRKPKAEPLGRDNRRSHAYAMQRLPSKMSPAAHGLVGVDSTGKDLDIDDALDMMDYLIDNGVEDLNEY